MTAKIYNIQRIERLEQAPEEGGFVPVRQVKQKMTYEEVCKELGDYIPSVGFIKITTRGTIGFTLGKPHEIRTLLRNVRVHGFVASKKLEDAVYNL